MADGTTMPGNEPGTAQAPEKMQKPGRSRLPGRPLSSLPTPEPWPEPVNGEELLNQISAAYSLHMILPPGAADTLALWVAFAHTIDAAEHSPRLCFSSPQKRCGKTTALSITQRLVPRPFSVANLTPATIFRSIDAVPVTMLIDEADTFIHGKSEMLGILNSGHSRSSAHVPRCVGDNYEPRLFSTSCAVAFALIGRLPDTLEDRTIVIPLKRRRPDEPAPERIGPGERAELDEFARKLARWAQDNIEALRGADPAMPAGLHDRAADNWRPLLAIAGQAGGGWPHRAAEAAKALAPGAEDDSIAVLLLADIRAVFAEQGVQRIASARLVDALLAMEDRPWMELQDRGPLTPGRLAHLLKPFGIRPGTTRFDPGDGSGSTAKGYYRADFTDAFARYLRA
jgi:putative DNA primase/helicase